MPISSRTAFQFLFLQSSSLKLSAISYEFLEERAKSNLDQRVSKLAKLVSLFPVVVSRYFPSVSQATCRQILVILFQR